MISGFAALLIESPFAYSTFLQPVVTTAVTGCTVGVWLALPPSRSPISQKILVLRRLKVLQLVHLGRYNYH
jgi:hypothetical protein